MATETIILILLPISIAFIAAGLYGLKTRSLLGIPITVVPFSIMLLRIFLPHKTTSRLEDAFVRVLFILLVLAGVTGIVMSIILFST